MSDELAKEAKGSGLKYLELLRARYSKCSIQDQGVVTTRHTKVIREGVHGELTVASLKAFRERYKLAKGCIRELGDLPRVSRIA